MLTKLRFSDEPIDVELMKLMTMMSLIFIGKHGVRYIMLKSKEATVEEMPSIVVI